MEKFEPVENLISEYEESKALQPTEHKSTSVSKGSLGIIEAQRAENLRKISESDVFKKKSAEVDVRKVNADLDKDANEVLSDELKNELDQYEIKKRKQALDYKQKLEKNVVKEEVKAEIASKRYETALKRYGYLYKPVYKDALDESGNPLLDEEGNKIKILVPNKDFTPNKFINRSKELANWYDNLSDTIKKAIWTTVKMSLFVGLGSLVIWLIIELFKKLAASGALI